MHLPDLSKEPYLVFDVETHDPGLKVYGTNAVHRARGGQLLGFAVYSPGGFNEYYPYKPGCPAGLWLRDQIARSPKVVGANIKYDLLWLLGESLWGRTLAKRQYGDVLLNAALLDENDKGGHNLDHQATLYGLHPKQNDELLHVGAQIGLSTLQQVKQNMHLIQEHGPEVLAEYAKHDAYLTGKVWEAQQPLLKAEKLTRVQDLEERFLPLLVLMEAQGVKVDVDRAMEVSDELTIRYERAVAELKEMVGFALNPQPSDALREYLGGRFILPRTPSGLVKVGSEDLAPYLQDPIVQTILRARKLAKNHGTFIKGYILDRHVNGRLYPNIYQISGEDEYGKEGGTSTGRQAYAKPNLQNLPIRDPEWGPLIRSLFVAEDGSQLMSADFSQQEPRWAVHWAVEWGIAGAQIAADEFINNPNEDWHGKVAELSGVSRAGGKILVLARTYAAGRARIQEQLVGEGVPPEQIDATIDQFDSRFGFLRTASTAADNFAAKNGYVRTYYGRKRRFVLWEPKVSWNDRQALNIKAMPYEEAYEYWFVQRHRPIVRSKTYKAFNAVVQGSSADQTKKSVIDAFDKYDLLPSFQVHDELVDSSIDSDQKVKYYEESMLHSVNLHVPSKVGIKVGGHWQK